MTGSLRPTWPQRWWPGGWARALWVLTLFGLSPVLLDQLLRQAGRPDLTLFNAGGSTPGLAMVSAATVGPVLASRRPRHLVGPVALTMVGAKPCPVSSSRRAR